MHLRKTVLLSSILLSFTTLSYAAPTWVEPDGSIETVKPEDPNGAHNPIKADLTQEDEGKVFSGDIVMDTTGSKGIGVLLGTAGETIVNKGNIWVIGSGNGDAMSTAYGVETTIINQGTIYVDGNNVDNNKGMTVNPGGHAINKGTIVIKDGASGMIDASGDGDKSLINRGTIAVIGDGVGINYRKGVSGEVLVANEKEIIVTGSGIGVKIGEDPRTSSLESQIFTNSGSIIATGEDSKAIQDSTIFNEGNSTVRLIGNSHVEGKVDLGDNTTLEITGLNNKESLELADGAGNVSISDNSSMTFKNAEEQTLKFKSINTDSTSSTNFEFNYLGNEKDKVLEIGTVTGEGSFNVGYTAEVADELAAGADQADLFNGLNLGDYNLDKVHVSNDGSAWGSDAIYYKDGTVQILQENALLSSATDLAITNALMWRSQLSNLTDRMGTLRTMPETAGAWARYNGGRLDGRGIQHDYNTVEVGFDKAISNNVMLGISFDYTKGDTDLDAGTSDNNTYTLGFYGSYFNESGCFLDAMLKVGRIDTDYDLNNGISEKGDYMLTGTIVGIETGHRWNIQNYFIEPQVQLTYSYLRPENYKTNLREVKFDDMKSLIARVGIMGGMKFAEDRGSAYVKASYNHDFLGDIEGNYSGVTAAGNAVRVNVDDELDDNWGEVSLGASYQVTDSVNTFVDVGTGFGGDIDQKWRVNLGARYVF